MCKKLDFDGVRKSFLNLPHIKLSWTLANNCGRESSWVCMTLLFIPTKPVLIYMHHDLRGYYT